MDAAKWGWRSVPSRCCLWSAAVCSRSGHQRKPRQLEAVGRAGYVVVRFHHAERLFGCVVGKSHAGAVQEAERLAGVSRTLRLT